VALGALIVLMLGYPLLSPAILSLGSTVVLVALAAWARLVHPMPVDDEIEELEFESAPDVAGEPAGG
jgi:hypothetical protein